MRRNILVIALTVLLVAAGVGYFLVDRAADERLRLGLDNAVKQLPEGSKLTYRGADANVLTDSARVDEFRLATTGAHGGLMEMQIKHVQISGFSPDEGGTLDGAKIQGIHLSTSSAQGETIEATAESASVQDATLAMLLNVLRDLSAGVDLDGGALYSLGLGRLVLRDLALVGPGITVEMDSLSLEGLDAHRIAVVTAQGLELRKMQVTSGDGPSAGSADEEAPDGQAEGEEKQPPPQSMNITVGTLHSEDLDYVALARALENKGLGIINELAGPFAARTELSAVKLVMGDLQLGYDNFVGTFEENDGTEMAEGSMEAFTLETTGQEGSDEAMFGDLAELGYTQPIFSARWTVIFDKAGPLIKIQPFTFTLQEGGDLNLGLTLAPPERVAGLRDLSGLDSYQGFGMHAVSLEFDNAGLFERLLRRKAQQDGVSQNDVRQDLIEQVDRQFATHPEIAEALKTFLNDPRRISIEVALPRPIPMEMFAMAMLIQPRAIAENADVKVGAN